MEANQTNFGGGGSFIRKLFYLGLLVLIAVIAASTAFPQVMQMPLSARGVQYHEKAAQVAPGQKYTCGINGQTYIAPTGNESEYQNGTYNCEGCGNPLITFWTQSLDDWGSTSHTSICQKQGGTGSGEIGLGLLGLVCPPLGLVFLVYILFRKKKSSTDEFE